MTLVLWVEVLVGAVVLSGLAVAVSIRIANRVGLHDHPDGGRKVQERPMPKLGGVAIALSFSAAAVGALLLVGRTDMVGLATAVLVPALVSASIGYLDDARTIQPVLRLVLQAGIGVLAWVLGTRVEVFGIAWLDLVVTVLWFMVLINGINLLDNSDGLAGATVLVSALGASVIAIMFGQELISLLGLALVGVCVGYLWHNWYPARVYMGDSGAYFLGTMLASLIIGLRPSTVEPWIGVLLALLLAALPVLDTSYVVIRRLWAGIHPFTAGRDHLSHVLQDRGRSVAGSVLTLQAGLFVTTAVAIGVAATQLP